VISSRPLVIIALGLLGSAALALTPLRFDFEQPDEDWAASTLDPGTQSVQLSGEGHALSGRYRHAAPGLRRGLHPLGRLDRLHPTEL
jgi:hypothetical protein